MKLMLKINRIHKYERNVLTPDAAASLVASGCGCGDGTQESQSSYALAEPDAPASSLLWSGVIGVEGELTGDGRLIEMNALRWENLPIPIRYAPIDNGGHDGAQVAGRILTIERKDDGKIYATGDFDAGSSIGMEAARQVGEGLTVGVSMDLDSVSFEIRVAGDLYDEAMGDPEDEGSEEYPEPERDEEDRVTVVEMGTDDEIMVTTDARIRAATIVSIPAFSTANIQLDSEMPEVVSEAEAIAASAAGALTAAGYPVEPPAAWFSNPNLDGPTPLTVTPDGRVYGHLAVWGTCHTAYSGQCVEPPHSESGYAYFRTGAVLTDEGSEIAVGRITLDTMHAGRTLSANDTMAHYEHTGRGAADVAAGEDAFGIWVAGSVRPGMTEDRVRTLRASPISGDWRRIGSSLELVAALAVNSPGFPVPRAQGLVASGGVMTSLIASGMLAPTETDDSLELSADDVRYLKQLAARERRADAEQLAGIQNAADAIATRIRATRANLLARQIGRN